jgi:hypothetical protein
VLIEFEVFKSTFMWLFIGYKTELLWWGGG